MSAISYEQNVHFSCINRGNGLLCKDAFYKAETVHGAWRMFARKAGWSKHAGDYLCPDCTNRNKS